MKSKAEYFYIFRYITKKYYVLALNWLLNYKCNIVKCTHFNHLTKLLTQCLHIKS